MICAYIFLFSGVTSSATTFVAGARGFYVEGNKSQSFVGFE